MSWLIVYVIIGWLMRAAMIPVVLRRQFAPGAAVAWLGIVFLHPYVGVALYLLVGENRLGPRRTQAYHEIQSQFRKSGRGAEAPNWQSHVDPIYHPMVLQAEKISGLPIRFPNAVDFLMTTENFTDRLAADIDAAQRQVHLLYYIFAGDDIGEKIVCALERAARRGVQCRVLVDAMASRKTFFRAGLAERLTNSKVQVSAAMPVTSLKRGLSRMDMRNHRKLALIDDATAYVGSHNLINPDYGGRCGGPWVDLSGRFNGPIVTELAEVFAVDWAFETGEVLTPTPAAAPAQPRVNLPMQAVPTGPVSPGETYRRLLLGAIQSARKQIILTTPYFVPDEPSLVSLMMAADRGVNVKLVVPRLSDSMSAAAAGRAHFATLMEAGVEIYLYRPGLLHAKTTTVDDAFALFGSANLDVRSFHLNFELSTVMYGREVTDQLRAIQISYLNDCDRVDQQEWLRRSVFKRYADGAISMLSPLL